MDTAPVEFVTALKKADAVDLPALPSLSRLADAFLAGRTPRTLDAYRRDLTDFAGFIGAANIDDAARNLLAAGQGSANGLALSYRARMQDAGLAAATVNRRLAALRSMVALARTLGLVAWSLDVQGLKAETYRDTRGPGLQGFRDLLLAAAAQKNTGKAARDLALLWLLFSPALRRAEVVGLDLADIDLAGSRLQVLGKGRTAKESVTLPMPAVDAVRAWLQHRGDHDGPLFVNLDRSQTRGRLTGRGLHSLVVRLGKLAGIGAVRPHGLRHAGITAALDSSGGNLRACARFSRHRDVRVLQRYDDAREDLGGAVARMVAAKVGA